MVKIGEEITRKVDYTPGTLEIVEYVRPKYARPEAEQTEDKPAIVVAPVPDQVIPKGIPGAGLLTHIVVSKYIDHLPFYRQIGMFNRDHGWAIHKSIHPGSINSPVKACSSDAATCPPHSVALHS